MITSEIYKDGEIHEIDLSENYDSLSEKSNLELIKL